MLFNKRAASYLIVLALAAWVIICYNPFLLWFQNDDFVHILLSSKGVMFQRNTFRPVCDLSVMLDYYIWKNYAPGYHLTSLILHVICTGLVYIFCKALFSTYPQANKRFVALISSALFFAYPFHSEAVFWILGRSATLGAIFSLLFLIFFLKKDKKTHDIVIYVISFAIALLTYESSWVLPIVAFVLMKAKNDSIKAARFHFVALCIIFLTYLSVRWMVIHQVVGGYEGVNFLQFNIGQLCLNFGRFIVRSVTNYGNSNILLTVGFIIVPIGVLLFYLKTKQGMPRKVYFMLACFVVALLPCLSLGIDTHGTEGERFLYLPSIFGCIGFALIFCAIQRQRLRQLVIAAMFVLYAAQLTINAGNYRFAGSIVKQTLAQIAKTPVGKNVLVEGLPKSQHGALILENGLDDAQLMYLPERKINIRVLSWRYELDALKAPYKTVVLPAAANTTFVKYVFTDSALFVYP